MRTRLIAFAVGLILALSVSSLAHWDPGDDYKMHYPQLPIDLVDPGSDGIDVHFDPRLADDWQCCESGYVDDIHFWISWQGDSVGSIGMFYVAIHSNNPYGPHGHSVPAADWLWDRHFYPGEYEVRNMEDHYQDWFDPYTQLYLPRDHRSWQQINIVNIPDPFYQEAGTIYWLEIDIWEAPNVGWKVSGSPHFMDNAVYYWSPYYHEITNPVTHDSLDLAFVITSHEPSATEFSAWGRIKALFK